MSSRYHTESTVAIGAQHHASTKNEDQRVDDQAEFSSVEERSRVGEEGTEEGSSLVDRD